LKKNQVGVYEAFEEILRRTGIYLKFGKIPIPRGEETTRINLTLPKSLKAEWDGTGTLPAPEPHRWLQN